VIIWITGQSESGKTSLGLQMQGQLRKFGKSAVLLDGDAIRDIYPTGFSEDNRHNHNLRIAKIAKLIDSQGVDVIVSVIAPYKKTRKAIQEITGCVFIYLSGGKVHPEYPYEYEDGVYYFGHDLQSPEPKL